MLRPARALLPLLTLLFASGCGGKHTTAPPAGPISLESSRASSATIGPDGGSLVATSSNGIRYTLVVPDHALAAAVRITITPVARMPLLGTGALAAGLDCRPSGLTFAHAAVLLVEHAGTPGAGTFAIGFSATADADSFALNGAVASGGAFTMQVAHFSIQGIQFGTTADLATYPAPPTDQVDLSFNDRISRAVLAGDLSGARTLAAQWESASIGPELGNAGNDTELLAAIDDYDLWRQAIDFINGFSALVPLATPPQVTHHFEDPALATPEHDAGEAAAPTLRAAISGNVATACEHESFGALANVVFWQVQAQALGVADAAHQLDIASVYDPLCAKIVLDGLSLPGTLQVGFPHSLDLDLGVRFGDHAVSKSAPFRVDVAASNASLQNPSGFTDAGGHYTTVLSANAEGPVNVDVTAHLVFPGTTQTTPIQATFHSSGSAGQDLSGDYVGTLFVLCGSISSQWTIAAHLTQNQNSFSGTWSVDETFCNPGITGGILSGAVSEGKVFDFSMTHPPCGEPSDPPLTIGVRMDPGDTLFVTPGRIGGKCHGGFGCSHGTSAPSVVSVTELVFVRVQPVPDRQAISRPASTGARARLHPTASRASRDGRSAPSGRDGARRDRTSRTR